MCFDAQVVRCIGVLNRDWYRRPCLHCANADRTSQSISGGKTPRTDKNGIQ